MAPDESVIDVGCGCGASSLTLAEAVGHEGFVLGIDISEKMLDRARERAQALPQLNFVLADAAIHKFRPVANLVFSRFGVMFFDNPVTAFSNLRGALAAGGRLAFACWRQLEDNPWLSVPFAAASAVVSATKAPLPPDAPGPLALAASTRLRGILKAAGFEEVALQPFDHPLPLGGNRGLDAAADDALTLGPTARLLSEASDEDRARALAAVKEALAPHARGEVVELAAGAWVVTARAK